MSSRVFVLGNGESRKNINLNGIKSIGPVYGCNALYRDFTPNALICVDGGMMHEVYSSGYAIENKCYFRSFTKLPEFVYSDMTNIDSLMNWSEGYKVENERDNRTQFVMNGTDPNQMQKLYEYHKSIGSDKTTMNQLFSQHHQWITWVEDDDNVEIIPEEYSGWSAGPIAVRIALEKENPTDVFLIGFDLGSATGKINNVYKGTSNYVTHDSIETPSSNWINQHMDNFKNFPNVKFWKVNPSPLGTDDTSQFVEKWRDFDNVEYLEQENLNLVLDYGVLL